MNRFNYRQTHLSRLLSGVPPDVLSNRLRLPLAIVAAALFGCAATWWLETHRLAALDAEFATLQMQVRRTAADRVRAEHLLATLTKLRAQRAGVAAARREAIVTTNAIARIGNGLPAQTWLTAVGTTPAGTWTISGRSTRVSEIGTMLQSVQTLDLSANARLVSIAARGRSGRVLDFVIDWDARL